MSTTNKSVVGVDVGGTFTDVFIFDEANGTCNVAKVPSTHGDQSKGIRQGIAERVADLGDVSTIVHGTTVGTNALLERKGARTGLITTRGFRDVLEMRRRDRPQTWGLWGTFDPIIPRDLRLEVDERVLADGTIYTELDEKAVRAATKTLLERDAESLCIFFINSYANNTNERRAFEIAKDLWPNDHISVASQILPEIREFERGSTASLNAYLQPVVGSYLEKLETGLRAGGFNDQVLIVQSNGGVMSLETAKALPVRTALSGPAAGVIAGAHIGVTAGFPNLITCDMGGTSFDVSLIAKGESALAPQTSIDFGMVIRTPMIEITTIGAGGGSIAWVDRGGLLQIGPQSAGSNPGPVCYALGNDRPTVTDANVVLGRINAERPIGGGFNQLDLEAAKTAIATHVATPLGLDTMAAAEAIIHVANARMAGAIRLVSVERGHDPKQFVAMPFGGGGALHAGALIKDVGLAKALVPRFPGVTSALGCVIADMRHDRVHTLNSMLDDLDIAALDREMVDIAQDGEALLEKAHVTFEGVQRIFELDMLYLGQTHTVSATLPVDIRDNRTNLTREIIREAFEKRYRETYGRLLENIAIRVMNLRVAVVGIRPKFDLSLLAPSNEKSVDDCLTGKRQIWIDKAWHEAAIYDRLALPIDAIIAGPAILEQPDTTIFIEPDLEGQVDKYGNLIIQHKER
ncbi:MAG: hydantoinase/oxoprolinase family protein [Fimbriimonadaceae bacterium]|nr:hydantoinase/oxoprolinase family protein [Alphaproteobacteria bacterium]